MRLLGAVAVLVGVATPALAQSQGSFVLDAMTTPGRHFGFGYYLTDGLSLRPSLGAGYAEGYGMTFNLGTEARWEVLTQHRVSPYTSASINYLKDPGIVQIDATGAPIAGAGSNVFRYGAGVGLRSHIKYGLSAVVEGRVMNSALTENAGAAYYGQPTVQDGAHFEAALGISYAFH
ncbi:MAG: hypothetical protein ACHQNV_02420 [Vicinamibacteria bacterium]